MQLTRILGGVVLVVGLCGLSLGLGSPAQAQSLSPMRNLGLTPSTIKGFRLIVGNPYKTRMTFLVLPMDAKFRTAAADAVVSAPELRLAPGASRPVIVQFKIDPQIKERTIGVCVQPKDLEGPVLPRVCGTYTGKLLSAGG
jgi:hypothetical protein